METTKVNDGGPAFPTPPNEAMQADEGWVPCHAGMTLRDYFAAKAMQALVAADLAQLAKWSKESLPTSPGGEHYFDGGDCENWSSRAYQIANAMIYERATRSS